MQFNQLRYVLEAANKKSFSAAAKSLFISQPSLSQQIMNLEKELGIPLFIRHSKSVSLTEAGEYFVQSARRILNDTEQLKYSMLKYSSLQTGTLKLGMLWIGGYLNLPQLITDYHDRHPLVTCHLDVEGSQTLFHMLKARDLHAIFIIGSEKQLLNQDLHYQKIMEDRYMAVISTDNPLSRRSILSISDLADQKIILPSKASAFRPDLERLFIQNNISPSVLCETSQSDIVIQLASNNLAIGFSSNSIAVRLKNPGCKIVPLEVTLSRPIYYVTHKDMLNYPTVHSFTDFIKDRFQPDKPIP